MANLFDLRSTVHQQAVPQILYIYRVLLNIRRFFKVMIRLSNRNNFLYRINHSTSRTRKKSTVSYKTGILLLLAVVNAANKAYTYGIIFSLIYVNDPISKITTHIRKEMRSFILKRSAILKNELHNIADT